MLSHRTDPLLVDPAAASTCIAPRLVGDTLWRCEGRGERGLRLRFIYRTTERWVGRSGTKTLSPLSLTHFGSMAWRIRIAFWRAPSLAERERAERREKRAERRKEREEEQREEKKKRRVERREGKEEERAERREERRESREKRREEEERAERREERKGGERMSGSRTDTHTHTHILSGEQSCRERKKKKKRKEKKRKTEEKATCCPVYV